MNEETLNRQHQLVLAIADEMARMEQNLYRMPDNTIGRKQLARSLQRMKTHLLATGYEIVEMLGKPYVDGMKVLAHFQYDETLPEGQMLVTAVNRPQVNYEGEMIQAADITVSQNI